MIYTIEEALDFVKENDVKFIRLAFCDLFGMKKNISIMADELERAFEYGISFDGSAINGFSDISKSDLLLFPDPDTLNILPWRPQQGRVVRFLCDIKNPDKTSFIFDTRNVLKEAVKRSKDTGYICQIGTECEFYLFKTDEEGNPTNITHDEGGYLDISPLDKGENIRREICLTLEEMGIKPETSHHEQGPGQNEIDFKYSDALTAADNFITFKSVVKAIASGNGLFASFLPKPLPNNSGNGLHINLSLSKNGFNIFKNEPDSHCEVAESFIAGILNKISDITAFLNPLVNSYERFGSFAAPKHISWSHQNRSQLIRVPASTAETNRMELRSPDPSLNPYLAFALLIHAGLDGIENDMKLPRPLDFNLYKADKSILDNATPLPENLGEALVRAKHSSFVNKVLGNELIDKYITIKESEYNAFKLSANKDAFYFERYFKVI